MKPVIRDIPSWCNLSRINKEGHIHKCCACRKGKVYHQEGDGKYTHSLCLKCWNELYYPKPNSNLEGGETMKSSGGLR